MDVPKIAIDTKKILMDRDEREKIGVQIDELYKRRHELDINNPKSDAFKAIAPFKGALKKMSKVPKARGDARIAGFSWSLKDELMVDYYVGHTRNSVKVDDVLKFNLKESEAKDKEKEIAETRRDVEIFQLKAEAAQRKLNRLKAAEQL